MTRPLAAGPTSFWEAGVIPELAGTVSPSLEEAPAPPAPPTDLAAEEEEAASDLSRFESPSSASAGLAARLRFWLRAMRIKVERKAVCSLAPALCSLTAPAQIESGSDHRGTQLEPKGNPVR